MTEPVRTSVLIENARGLHARASAKFVACARQYDANVIVSREGQEADASSIMDLLMLAAGPGSEIELNASGPQAREAIAALSELVKSRFGEEA
ncbi:MAG: HPr family phosphocarrier protein [Caulobacterales bacterium]